MKLGEFLARCQPAEVIVLVAIVATALVVLAGLFVWRSVRLKQAQAALKQESVKKGLSVTEIQQLLLPSATPFFVPQRPRTDAQAVGEIVMKLTEAEASGPEMEQYLAMIQAMDSASKQLVAEAFDGLNAEKDQYFGVIRGLSGVARENTTTQFR